MRQILKDLKDFTYDILFPIECICCGKKSRLLCEPCLSLFKKIEVQICMICNKPSHRGVTHPVCANPYSANGLISLFSYKDKKVATAIICGKYKFLPVIYEILADYLANWLIRENLDSYLKNFIVIPLPLAAPRKRWRGFNQAEILGQSLSKLLNIPYAEALTRTKSTKTQKDLKKEARTSNVKGVFALATKVSKPWLSYFVKPIIEESETNLSNDTKNKSPKLNIDNIRNKNIILIDDVITTGNTLAEATKVLKRNGAKQVWCLTLARD